MRNEKIQKKNHKFFQIEFQLYLLLKFYKFQLKHSFVTEKS